VAGGLGGGLGGFTTVNNTAVMGHVGDVFNMSVAFCVPLVCFALIAVYGFSWPRLSGVGSRANHAPTAELFRRA